MKKPRVRDPMLTVKSGLDLASEMTSILENIITRIAAIGGLRIDAAYQLGDDEIRVFKDGGRRVLTTVVLTNCGAHVQADVFGLLTREERAVLSAISAVAFGPTLDPQWVAKDKAAPTTPKRGRKS